MPHSINSASSTHTFDLGDDGRPMTSDAVAARTKRESGNFGVALTSTSSQDEQAPLPSQSKVNAAYRRKSAPGADQYAAALANISNENFNFDEIFLQQHKPGDRASLQSFSYNDASKRRSQYFEEQFQYKGNTMEQARDKAQKMSPIIAELKTNVIIKDEFTLITDLSHHLAQRYSRPESSIMIKVDHSACLAMGGNFDPCYLLVVNAAPALMGPMMNKRNASLIQSFMAEILSVSPERGIVTFKAIPEENMALNGTTMLAEAEKAQKQNGNDPASLKKAITEATMRSIAFPNNTGKSNGEMTSGENPAQVNRHTVAERPSTSHGAFNGLRMNGVSTDVLVGKYSFTPNGRPQTIGSTSVQESIKKDPLPHVSKQTQRSSVNTSQHRNSAPRKSAMVGTQKISAPIPKSINGQPVTLGAAPTANGKPKSTPLVAETREKNTYLDNISTLTSKMNRGAEPQIVVTDEDDAPVAPNTAKRRSTITATPKPPPLEPPPVPEDTKSLSSRLSKRKSLLKLRLFKRSSIPAWYEQ